MASSQWRRQVSEFGGGGHLRGNTHFGGKDIISQNVPSPSLPKFLTPGFFFRNFFGNFFPDISNFFQTFKNCPGLAKFFTDLPKIFPRPTKNVIFLATFHKFLQFWLSNSDVSTTFGHFSTKVALLPVWFLHPWLSATNGFYRNYQKLGEQNGGAENNFGGGHLPPLATCNCCKPPPPGGLHQLQVGTCNWCNPPFPLAPPLLRVEFKILKKYLKWHEFFGHYLT